MSDSLDTDDVEPATTTIRTFAVRRDDDDLDVFVDTIVALLDQDRVLIDLSHHDRRADIVELRVAHPEYRSER
jgi:hypothetical protein